ncbi:MAG: undecaprenyl-phosphate glucose phosphotransferase [Planctomycetota bacterium]
MTSLRAHSAVYMRLLLDLLLTGGTFLAVYMLATRFDFPRKLQHETPPLSWYLAALPVLFLAFAWATRAVHLYRPRRARSYGQLAVDIVKVHFHVGVLVCAVSFFARSVQYSREVTLVFFCVNPIIIYLNHVIWQARDRRRFEAGLGTRSCLVIGHGRLAFDFARQVQEHVWTGLKVCGFLDSGADEERVVPRSQVLGGLDDLETVLEKHQIKEVIVALPFRAMGVLAGIDQRLSQSLVGLRWVPDLEALNTLSREVEQFDTFHLIGLRSVKSYGVNAAIKRTLDIVGSATMLIVLAPFLGLIALICWVTQGRPILYCQERMGLDGMVFPMWKFRTMVTDAEALTGPVWADDNDPRCTPFGAFLRRTSLDELPQLWNVLRGQMSLVGPRPERPILIEEFRQTVPRYMLRHRMKAGVTGWAQVNGWRGKTSLKERIQFDLYYLKQWSLWLDIKILLFTVLRAWKKTRTQERGAPARDLIRSSEERRAPVA